MPEDQYSTMVSNSEETIKHVSSNATFPEQEKSFKGTGHIEISLESITFTGLPTIERLEELEDFSEDECGDEDGRSRVSNTTEFPWRAICQLIITRIDGKKARGTGWLVGPNTIITAGHCVYSKVLKSWNKSIEVYPGKDHDQSPFDSYTSSIFWTVEGWKEKLSPQYDYGAIILEQNIGEEIGYFGFRWDFDSEINNKNATNAGYPADKKREEASTQWTMSGEVELVSDGRQLAYMIDTAGGNSGGPIWLESSDYQVIGIHAYGECPNLATRINKDVFKNIKYWKGLRIE